MSGYLSKQDIFKAQDIQTEDVKVPEWGGTVRVRGMTGSDRDRYERSIMEQNAKRPGEMTLNLTNARARLVSMCVVDETDALLFSEQEVGVLGTKSAAALSRIVDVARRLSGLSNEDMEELAGNSDATTSNGSRTA